MKWQWLHCRFKQSIEQYTILHFFSYHCDGGGCFDKYINSKFSITGNSSNRTSASGLRLFLYLAFVTLTGHVRGRRCLQWPSLCYSSWGSTVHELPLCPRFFPKCCIWKCDIQFSGACAELRKAIISFVMSVCPSVYLTVRLEQFAYQWKDFHEIVYLNIYVENLSREFKFHYYLTRIVGTLHEDQYTFLIISCSVPLIIRKFSHKICRKNQDKDFSFNTGFFFKSYPLWDNVERFCTAGQTTDDYMAHAHCVLDN